MWLPSYKKIKVTQKAKQCASGPSKSRSAKTVKLYFTHRVNILLRCRVEGVSKEEKIAKLPMRQWPNCDMEEQQVSVSQLL